MMLPLSWIHILWTPLHHQKHQVSMVMIDFRSFLKNSFFFWKILLLVIVIRVHSFPKLDAGFSCLVPLPVGTALRWIHDWFHRLENTDDITATAPVFLSDKIPLILLDLNVMSATLLIGYDMDARATTGCVVKMIFLLTHTWLRTLKKLLETFRTLKNLFLISHDSMDKFCGVKRKKMLVRALPFL